MNKTKYYDLWALMGVIIILALLFAATANSDEWRFDAGYNTWTVTIGHKVDYEQLEKTRKDVDVKIEIVTYGHDWCKLVLTATDTTDWAEVRKWVRSLNDK